MLSDFAPMSHFSDEEGLKIKSFQAEYQVGPYVATVKQDGDLIRLKLLIQEKEEDRIMFEAALPIGDIKAIQMLLTRTCNDLNINENVAIPKKKYNPFSELPNLLESFRKPMIEMMDSRLRRAGVEVPILSNEEKAEADAVLEEEIEEK